MEVFVRTRAAMLILLALALTGCAATPSAAGSSSAAPATSTPSSSPTPSATPTPTPSPTPTSSAGSADPSTWIVSDAGMGPLVLGMPFADAITAVPGLQDGCTHAYYRSDNTLWIAWWQHEGVLEEATWYGGGAASPHTSGGLGIGSTVADVLKAYPKAVHEFKNHDYLVAGRIVFGFQGDGSGTVSPTALVDSIGATSHGPEYEYCG
jgi:hypothetical protein